MDSKEEERRKIMEAILNEHYGTEEEAPKLECVEVKLEVKEEVEDELKTTVKSLEKTVANSWTLE